MTSVERIVEYKDLPPEGSGRAIISIKTEKEEKEPEKWPQKGGIILDDVKARYRKHMDLAVRGVSFKIQPGEHIGICGRTGRQDKT